MPPPRVVSDDPRIAAAPLLSLPAAAARRCPSALRLPSAGSPCCGLLRRLRRLRAFASCCGLWRVLRLRPAAACCGLLRPAAACCGLLRPVAACRSLLRLVATCCGLLRRCRPRDRYCSAPSPSGRPALIAVCCDNCDLLRPVAAQCGILRVTAVCCSSVRPVATYCGLLQLSAAYSDLLRLLQVRGGAHLGGAGPAGGRRGRRGRAPRLRHGCVRARKRARRRTRARARVRAYVRVRACVRTHTRPRLDGRVGGCPTIDIRTREATAVLVVYSGAGSLQRCW